MADISFVCPQCNQELEAPADLAGEIVECPSCETQLTVPDAEVNAPVEPPIVVLESTPDRPAPSDANACSECGAALEAGAVLCMQCGYHAKLGKKIDTSFD